MTITWSTDVNAPCCPGEIIADDGRSVLIQTDWDYPGTATAFGWSTIEVQRCPKCGGQCKGDDGVYFVCESCEEEPPLHHERCDHDGTDGTVDCESCGCKASQFIQAADEWLADHDGAQADDPGYFTE